MAEVALNFKGKTVPEKIEYSSGIVKKMTGNASFVTPAPTLAVVTITIQALKDAWIDAQDGGKTKTVILNQKEDSLDLLMSQLATYVQFASGGDELKILSSGMGVKKAATPSGTPIAPINLLAKIGDEGTIKLTWDAVPGARSYAIQITENPTDNSTWTHFGISTSAKFVATGLVSGKKYWFRVSAIGAKSAQSSWSDPAGSMAG